VSSTDVTVVLEGETGTGKELIARAIHAHSSRAERPFEVFDCSSVAENLIESELFGHVKGAFTGADRERKGIFELAHEGTVFLDEIGELGLDLQPKLLRVLESREVRRVGGTHSTRLNVRMIAATHRDLAQEVRQGRFREDLFYRLSVLKLHIPPLRDRKEDIPLITSQLLKNLASGYGIAEYPKVIPETFEILKSHHWPGNVRELRNVLSRALAMGNQVEIQPKDLLLSSTSASFKKKIDSLAGRSLEEIEKAAIIQTLKAHHGNKTQTAKDLGIAYSTLHEKIRKYGIRQT
jgi:transcriptional regulator with PAS, ATPase and Fis domain